jgi:hypothetical protein
MRRKTIQADWEFRHMYDDFVILPQVPSYLYDVHW